MDKLHIDFSGEINPNTYNLLEQIYSIITNDNCYIDEGLRKKLHENKE